MAPPASVLGDPAKSVAAPVAFKKEAVRLNSAITVSAIIKENDLPAKIREALTILRRSRQVIVESGLRADLHVDSNRFARAAALPEFAESRRVLRGKIYWGSPTDLNAVENAIEGVYE